LLTLGYGKRSIEETIVLLEQHDIAFLVDLRSAPYSRYHPDFSHDALRGHLSAHGMTYLYMGEELGGRPKDPACYDTSGRVDYAACRRRPAFRQGIGRLRTAWEQGRRVALLCSEARPEQCHRAKLVGAALAEEGIDVLHLDEDDTPLTQAEVMARLQDGQLSLLAELAPAKASRSRGKYAPPEE
jgi:uncharacterized protein (DUF488 family)